MAAHSSIAWTDSTFNPWIGCTKVSAGCDHCYAEAEWDHRRHRAQWGPGNPRSRTSASNWQQVRRWNDRPFYDCSGCGWRGDDPTTRPRCPTCDNTAGLTLARRRVFCASLGDVFDNEVPDDWRTDLFSLIYTTPNLDWIIVTKRIGNVERMTSESVAWESFRHRIILLATVCTQAEANRDIPKLLAVDVGRRGLSMEPLLGPVDIGAYLRPKFRQGGEPDRQELTVALDWVIVGGESGAEARDCNISWIRAIVGQCQFAHTPVFVKQLGARPVREDTQEAIASGAEPPHFGRITLLDRAGADPGEWPLGLQIGEWWR